MAPRRDAVLNALHLMFNAGWQADAEPAREICWDAIRLARALAAHPCAAHPDADALAPDYALTPWARIVGFYDALLAIDDSAAPRLSHAIALAEAGQAPRARQALESLLPDVPDTLRAHAHAALSHALRLTGDTPAARRELDRAIDCARNDADRSLLERRSADLQA